LFVSAVLAFAKSVFVLLRSACTAVAKIEAGDLPAVSWVLTQFLAQSEAAVLTSLPNKIPANFAENSSEVKKPGYTVL